MIEQQLYKPKDLEIINYIECTDAVYVDMIVNDRGLLDTLSNRQFQSLISKINSKVFNVYKKDYYIIVDQDPVGIVLTLVYKKNNILNVDKDLNNMIDTIYKYLNELTDK